VHTDRSQLMLVSSWEQEAKCVVRCIVKFRVLDWDVRDLSLCTRSGGLIGWRIIHVTMQGAVGLQCFLMQRRGHGRSSSLARLTQGIVNGPGEPVESDLCCALGCGYALRPVAFHGPGVRSTVALAWVESLSEKWMWIHWFRHLSPIPKASSGSLQSED
jgi:hypothetical protein